MFWLSLTRLRYAKTLNLSEDSRKIKLIDLPDDDKLQSHIETENILDLKFFNFYFFFTNFYSFLAARPAW